ncbi:MAG: hypothetical protein K2Z81_23830, partial [Cyanobacteria bacterium]|nr:hypothetical protein [Cyanobacteriota bacterium]
MPRQSSTTTCIAGPHPHPQVRLTARRFLTYSCVGLFVLFFQPGLTVVSAESVLPENIIAAYDRHDFKTAESALRARISAFSGKIDHQAETVSATLALIRLLEQTRRYNEARTICQKALTDFGSMLESDVERMRELQILRARIEIGLGNYAEAEKISS